MAIAIQMNSNSDNALFGMQGCLVCAICKGEVDYSESDETVWVEGRCGQDLEVTENESVAELDTEQPDRGVDTIQVSLLNTIYLEYLMGI